MRQLITAVIILLSVITTEAQVTKLPNDAGYIYHAERIMFGGIDGNGNESWAEGKNTDIDIVRTGNHISFDRVGRTYVNTYGSYRKRYDAQTEATVYAWNAFDEEGRYCNFRIIYFGSGAISLEILYSKSAVSYQVPPQGGTLHR